MSAHQLTRDALITRRRFLRDVGFTAGGLSALAQAGGTLGLLSACGGDRGPVTPDSDAGIIEGLIVDRAGTIQPSLGQVFLMYGSGLQTGRSATVDPAGLFTIRDVAPGEWQLRFHAPRRAYVPEELPHPIRVTLAPKFTVSLRITVEVRELSDDMVEIYAGDDFFQEQPFGRENGETVVRVGTPVCWYNVGAMPHTVTGGPWEDSGVLQRTGSFLWIAERPGVYPYRCRFHSPQMQATLRITE